MMQEAASQIDAHHNERMVHKIPVRNLWLLMLYASDLIRHQGFAKRAMETMPDEIPDLVAEMLTALVTQRLKRNLSRNYIPEEANLWRVRGRIDHLKTACHRLLERGQVACRYEALSINTPRNCYVRAALESLARMGIRMAQAQRCRRLASDLWRLGATSPKPNLAVLATDRFGRHDVADQRMVAAAKLAFELAIPTEHQGRHALLRPDRNIEWIRRLYEKAVAGFYKINLRTQGWRVESGKMIHWPIQAQTPGIDRILPSMRTDILLEHPDTQRRIIIDTKFNSILTQGWYRSESIRSSYIYQIYAYLKSQVDDIDPFSHHAEGILLHPTINKHLDESVVIQGHRIRFVTVDLSTEAATIRKQWLDLVAQAPGELHTS